MARKNGNEFEKLVEAVNETREVQQRTLEAQEKSLAVQEKMLAVQSSMLTRMEGVETGIKDLRTSVVASVEHVLEDFVETKIVSKSEKAELERRVERLEKIVLPPED